MRASLCLLVVCTLAFAAAQAGYEDCTSSITGNFNGTAIAEGNYIWFNGVLTVSGLSSDPVTLFVTRSRITFTANNQTYNIKVPNAAITFSPSTTTATTTFTALLPPRLHMGWDTELQISGLAGKDLMAGVTFPVPAGGLPGGIKDVTWSAEFSSFTSGLEVQWQWAAAVYTSFDTDYNALGVKPVDDNDASAYKNSDHAGTPENFKGFVTGGAAGGGGSNYTGSYSATKACVLQP